MRSDECGFCCGCAGKTQESKWLKSKLAENAYVFGEHLDASSRYIAAKAPRVMPTAVTGQALKTAVCVPTSPPSHTFFVGCFPAASALSRDLCRCTAQRAAECSKGQNCSCSRGQTAY